MTAQVLFFDVFFERDPHLNVIEQRLCQAPQKLYCRTIFILAIDTALPSDNALHFWKKLLE